MKKKVVVLSLGGSLIVPEKMDAKYLDNLKKTLAKFYTTHKFIITCGGGVIARKYIQALVYEHQNAKSLAEAGIRATRINARFMMQFFGKKVANDTLPVNMKQVIDGLRRNNVVFCGALRYADNATSDTTAAKLAEKIGSDFINLTNIDGLYSSNPKKNKKAKFIPEISWEAFEKKALGMKFKAGQSFILDQQSAILIRKKKITTYIIGKDVKQLSKALKGQKFHGTLITG